MESRDEMVAKRDRYRAAADRTDYPSMARSFMELASELDREIEVLDKAVQAEIAKRDAAAKRTAKAAKPKAQPSVIHKGQRVSQAQLAKALEQAFAEVNRERDRREREQDAVLAKAYGGHPVIPAPPEVRRTRTPRAVAKAQRLRAEANRLDRMAQQTAGTLSQGYRERAAEVRKQADEAEQENRR